MEAHAGPAGLRSVQAEWDEERHRVRAELRADPAAPDAARMSFRSIGWVAFGASGEVSSINVHDIPVEVSDRLPRVDGDDVIGRGVVDTQWLWVPLGTGPTTRRCAGTADVELVVTAEGLARLTLRFLEPPAEDWPWPTAIGC